MLDGVFNHCGRSFYAFRDLVENGEKSGYRDWFHVHRFPLNAYTPGKAVNYEAWWGYKSLPKFNTDNPQVRKMILDVAKYWIDLGVDGWRLDVPNEIDDDIFWGEFRQTVKSANPEAYILGEIWEALPRWVGDQMFDGVMNYPARKAVINWLNGDIDSLGFANHVENLLSVYNTENVRAMYNPLGSHDTERLMTMLGENFSRVRLAYLFQFAYPGAPAVYYGDEIGLTGGKDPECRKAFPWDSAEWNVALRNYIKKLILIRKQHPALRRGAYRRLMIDAKCTGYSFCRSLDGDDLIVIMNGSSETQEYSLPVPFKNIRELSGLINGGTFALESNQFRIKLPPWSGEIFQAN